VIRTGLCVVLFGARGTASGPVMGRFLLSNWPVADILVGHDAIKQARAAS
jgi:hypothetical protein